MSESNNQSLRTRLNEILEDYDLAAHVTCPDDCSHKHTDYLAISAILSLVEQEKQQFVKDIKAGKIPYINALVEQEAEAARVDELEKIRTATRQLSPRLDDYLTDRLAKLKDSNNGK